MDRYQLATLASWAGEKGIQGRKRMQKVIYFLQAAGCDLGCDFTLHHYGPYSRDVSDVCDLMVSTGFLEEIPEPISGGIAQFNYLLAEGTWHLLEDVNQKSPGRAQRLKMYEELAKQLFETDMWHLELGSTILYYYSFHEPRDWSKAFQDACTFKKTSPGLDKNIAAFEFAKSFHDQQIVA